MKLVAAKKDLLKAVTLANNVVSEKQVVPILSNLLIEAKGKDVFIYATDLKISMEHFFSAQVEKEGSITVSARKLFGIIKEKML